MTCRIFINYRRQTDAGFAGRIYDSLKRQLPRASIAIDVDSLLPGRDFEEQLSARISECDVFLAVIGPEWSDVRDALDARRLDDPRDLVRHEISTALRRGIPVIPVLVGAAAMPPDDALPDDVRGLAKRQALAVRHERFESDMSHVAGAIASLSRGAPGRRRMLARAGAIAVVAASAFLAAKMAIPHMTRTLSRPDDRLITAESTAGPRKSRAGVAESAATRRSAGTEGRTGSTQLSRGGPLTPDSRSQRSPAQSDTSVETPPPTTVAKLRESDRGSDARWSEWLSRGAYQAFFDSRTRLGMYPVRVEASLAKDSVAFRGIFESLGMAIENYEARNGIDDDTFIAVDKELRTEGYSRLFHTRLESPTGALNQATWIRTYVARDSVNSLARRNGGATGSPVAPSNKSGGPWTAWLSNSDYRKVFDQMVRVERYPSRVEATFVNGELLVRGAFARYPHDRFEFDSRVLLSDMDFEARSRELSHLQLMFHQRIVVGDVAYNQATWSR